MPRPDEQAMAWRELERADGTPVHVIVDLPRVDENGGDWGCRWRIESADGVDAVTAEAAGVDSLQAVELALAMVKATLEASASEYTFLGQSQLGFC